jgi:hypothetical protein
MRAGCRQKKAQRKPGFSSIVFRAIRPELARAIGYPKAQRISPHAARDILQTIVQVFRLQFGRAFRIVAAVNFRPE